MKYTVSAFVLFITIILFSCGKNQNNVEGYINELPDSLKPKLLVEFPDFKTKDTIDNMKYKDRGNNYILYNCYFGAGESSSFNYVQLFENKESTNLVIVSSWSDLVVETDPVSGLSGHVQITGFDIRVLQKIGSIWNNVTTTAIPDFLKPANRKSDFMDCILSNDTLKVTDGDKKVILLWKQSKFELQGTLPEKFGQQISDEERYKEFYDFFEEFKTAFNQRDTTKLNKLVNFPLAYYSSLNDAVSAKNEFTAAQTQDMYSFYFFPADDRQMDKNFAPDNNIPSNIDDQTDGKVIFVARLEAPENTMVYYFKNFDNGIRLFSIHVSAYGE